MFQTREHISIRHLETQCVSLVLFVQVVDALWVLLGEIYGRPGMLTVRENLFFSAELRLPSYMTLEQKNARVEARLVYHAHSFERAE